jgi:hypothetical protein
MADHAQDADPHPPADRNRFRVPRTSNWLPLLLVVVAAVAVCANTLGNGLVADDQYQIATNPWITSLRNLPDIFSSGVSDFDDGVSNHFRPMMYVLYSLVYAVAGTAATVQRNPVWKDSLSLWGDAAAKSPGSGVANLNYGFALMAAGQTEPGQR